MLNSVSISFTSQMELCCYQHTDIMADWLLLKCRAALGLNFSSKTTEAGQTQFSLLMSISL